MTKADRKMRSIASRLVRELPAGSKFREQLGLCLKFVNGEKVDGHKTCSFHEPDVLCISKGKEHKKYEFDNKVSIVRLWNGLIVGAMSFRNEYDEYTMDRAMEQVGRTYGRRLRILAGDRGQDTTNDISAHPTSRRPPTRHTSRKRSTDCSASVPESSRSLGTARATTVWDATSTMTSSGTPSTSCSQSSHSTSKGP